MRRVAVLGATGSIGRQALDVIARHPDRFSAWALTARADADGLFALVREFRPAVAALDIEPEQLPGDVKFCEWVFGEGSSAAVAARAKGCDVLAAVVGVAGLPAAMAALGAADRLLLANKEALVTGGGLV
ncbi:MAG: 1-deoxy-D-xylulose-5-phosphate reductoisomerase, partial [Clostridiales bacterium]|nr:1-deoxy-D-xylulose-5-phosphate reductoisomerase [Clostridiales bacterium]